MSFPLRPDKQVPLRNWLITTGIMIAIAYGTIPQLAVYLIKETRAVGDTQDVGEVFQRTIRKLIFLRALKYLPWHKKAANGAIWRVNRSARQTLARIGKNRQGSIPTEPLRTSWHLDLDRTLASISSSEVGCDAEQLEFAVEANTAKRKRNRHDVNRSAELALNLGDVHRVHQLAEQIPGTIASVRGYALDRQIRFLSLAGALVRAEKVSNSVLALENEEYLHLLKSRLRRLCTIQTLRGKSPDAYGKPQCIVLKAWTLIRRGNAESAIRELQQIPENQRFLKEYYFLALAAGLAETGNWRDLERLWHKAKHYFSPRYNPNLQLSKFFSPICNPPVPFSLLARLRMRIENRMRESSTPLLRQLLVRVLFRQAKALLVTGNAKRALKICQRLAKFSPSYRPGRHLELLLTELTLGPKAALALYPERPADTQLNVRLAAFAAEIGSTAKFGHYWENALQFCQKKERESKAMCDLLATHYAISSNKPKALESAKQRYEANAEKSSPKMLSASSYLWLDYKGKNKLKLEPIIRNNVLRSIANTDMQAWLLLGRLSEPKGDLNLDLLRNWPCRLLGTRPYTQMLANYKLERELKLRKEDEQLKRVVIRRHRLGRIIERMGEYWADYTSLH
jgi:tetratricopeptide (TPR) repeat protein